LQYRCAKFIATRYLQSAGERNVNCTHMLKIIFISCEAILGFTPLIVLWVIGIGMALPFSIAAAYSGELLGFIMLSSVILGSIGIWGIIKLIAKLVWPDVGFSIRKYRNHLICGCIAAALCGVAFIGVNNLVALYMVVPIAITAHLYHVSSTKS
jgi:hypothetical protein